MIGELTRSQINRLGERLRKGPPDLSDLEMLGAFRLSFDAAQQVVVGNLRGLGLEPSGRIKTTTSIIEKVKRESIRLSRLQDIAGCRIVVEDIAEQDRVTTLISDAFPKTTLIDRRRKHSHGYRAIHVVVAVGDHLVEIQIRTELQHLWAIWSETLAAALGQPIKYGDGPVEIQQPLLLESKIIELLELQEMDVAAGFQTSTVRLPSGLEVYIDRLSSESLPPEVLIQADTPDLIPLERKVKQRLTHEILKILKLESKRQKP